MFYLVNKYCSVSNYSILDITPPRKKKIMLFQQECNRLHKSKTIFLLSQTKRQGEYATPIQKINLMFFTKNYSVSTSKLNYKFAIFKHTDHIKTVI